MTAFKENQPPHSLQRDQLITIGDLIEFKAQLLKEISYLLKDKIAEPTKRWLKAGEVRKLLDISAGKLQYLRDQKIIPFTKLGGITYYDYQEIIQLMESTSHIQQLKVA